MMDIPGIIKRETFLSIICGQCKETDCHAEQGTLIQDFTAHLRDLGWWHGGHGGDVWTCPICCEKAERERSAS